VFVKRELELELELRACEDRPRVIASAQLTIECHTAYCQQMCTRETASMTAKYGFQDGYTSTDDIVSIWYYMVATWVRTLTPHCPSSPVAPPYASTSKLLRTSAACASNYTAEMVVTPSDGPEQPTGRRYRGRVIHREVRSSMTYDSLELRRQSVGITEFLTLSLPLRLICYHYIVIVYCLKYGLFTSRCALHSSCFSCNCACRSSFDQTINCFS
jgi:hypothetical protein